MPPRKGSAGFAFETVAAFETEGVRVCQFIERYCRHSKGQWAGSRIELEAWQRWVFNEIFRIDQDSGFRYWRQVLLMLPRKNAKSTKVAAAGHYLLGFDGEGGPEGYSGAWGTEQASITLEAAKAMRSMSPMLKGRTLEYAKEIRSPKNRGVWKVVSKLADMQQGTNPHFALIDEYHVHKRSDLYDAFKRGTQARQQPLVLVITTEADDDSGPLAVMQGGFAAQGVEIEQPTEYLTIARDHRSKSLMIRFGIRPDQDVDIEDPRVVRGCNPAGWLDPQRLIDEYLHAPGCTEHDFRRFHLNQLVTSEDQVIKPHEWDACMVEDICLPDNTAAYSASDIGFTGDWSAHVCAGRVGDQIVLEAKGWAPPGDGQELSIRGTVDTYAREQAMRLQMLSMLCDKWNARMLMQDWQSDGLPAAQFGMEADFMGPASQTFLELVRTRKLAHNGDPELRRHVLNMRRASIGGTSWKFAKHPRNEETPENGHFKTDIGFCAVAAAYQVEATGTNAIEEFGLFVD